VLAGPLHTITACLSGVRTRPHSSRWRVRSRWL
jgi:hypothetical protein